MLNIGCPQLLSDRPIGSDLYPATPCDFNNTYANNIILHSNLTVSTDIKVDYLLLLHISHCFLIPKCFILLCLFLALWLENTLSQVLHLKRLRQDTGMWR